MTIIKRLVLRVRDVKAGDPDERGGEDDGMVGGGGDGAVDKVDIQINA